MRNHVNVFIVSDEAIKKVLPLEKELELSLALDSVRARCFSSATVNLIKNENTGLMDTKMATIMTDVVVRTKKEAERFLPEEVDELILDELIRSCHVVAVIGDRITGKMSRELQCAAKHGKKIFAPESIKPELAQKEIPVSNRKLSAACMKIIRRRKV